MPSSYDEAMRQLGEAQERYERACHSVWRAAEREHPNVVGAIRRMGWDDTQGARFLCASQKRWDASPAALMAAGRGDEVIEVVEQALAGNF